MPVESIKEILGGAAAVPGSIGSGYAKRFAEAPPSSRSASHSSRDKGCGMTDDDMTDDDDDDVLMLAGDSGAGGRAKPRKATTRRM